MDGGAESDHPALFGIAYGCDPVRIVLPPNPPKGNFDFLVTVPKDPRIALAGGDQEETGLHGPKRNAGHGRARAQGHGSEFTGLEGEHRRKHGYFAEERAGFI